MYQETGIIRTVSRHAAPWGAVAGLLLVLSGCAQAADGEPTRPETEQALAADTTTESTPPLDPSETAEETRRDWSWVTPKQTETVPSSPTVTAPQPPAAAAPARWTPTGKPSWQYHLNASPDLTVRTDVLTSDLDSTSAAQVASLHASGRRAICYVSAGSWEDWRGDAAKFPSAVLGNNLDGWPGERWLDVRQLDVLRPLMEKRVAACDAKGFDGIEFDNVDGYTNKTGFALTANHQLAYNRALAALAHKYGLAVGLKNDVGQVSSLVADFDFAVNESCLQYNECGVYKPFIDAGKPVLHVEYVNSTTFCSDKSIAGFSSIAKRSELDSWRKSC